MIIEQKPNQHFDERKADIDMLVFHSTACDMDEALKIYDKCGVSPHYVIGTDGKIVQCVAEEKRAWHAGASYWRGIDMDINSHSIGIEILNSTLGQRSFSEKQIEVTIELSHEIIARYNIKPQNVVGHSDIAPLRKPDPGKCFFWKTLAENQIGLWYDINKRVAETNIAQLLSSIGYDTRSDEAIKASSYAFCRHYLPQFVCTITDMDELLNTIFPSHEKFTFMQEKTFLETLQAVAFVMKLCI